MKTSLKIRLKRVIVAIGIAINFSTASSISEAGVISQTFENYSDKYENETDLERAIRQGTYASSGSINLGIPSVTISGSDFIKVRRAHLTGGCNGMDWDFGGIDFISSNKAVKFIETFAQQAPMAIAYVIIQNLTDPIFSVITHVQEMAKRIMALSMNSCQKAMGLAKSMVGDLGKWDTNVFSDFCANEKVNDGSASSQYSFWKDLGKSLACEPDKAVEYLADKIFFWEQKNNSLKISRLKTEGLNLLWETAVMNGDIKLSANKPYSAQEDRENIGRYELLMNLIGIYYVPSLDETEARGEVGTGPTFGMKGSISPQAFIDAVFCGTDFVGNGATSISNWQNLYFDINSHSELLDPIKDYCTSRTQVLTDDTKVISCGTYTSNEANPPLLAQCVVCQEGLSYSVTLSSGETFNICRHDKLLQKLKEQKKEEPKDYIFREELSKTNLKYLLPTTDIRYNSKKAGIGVRIAFAFAKALENIDNGKSITEGNKKELALIYQNTPFDLWRLFNIYNIKPSYAKAIIRTYAPVLAKKITLSYLKNYIFSSLRRISSNEEISTELATYISDITRKFEGIKTEIKEKDIKEIEALQTNLSIENSIMQRIISAEKMLNNSVAYRILRSKRGVGMSAVSEPVTVTASTQNDAADATNATNVINSISDLLDQ